MASKYKKIAEELKIDLEEAKDEASYQKGKRDELKSMIDDVEEHKERSYKDTISRGIDLENQVIWLRNLVENLALDSEKIRAISETKLANIKASEESEMRHRRF